MSIRIAIAGLGQIARKQHLPAIAGSPDFVLAGTADPVAADASHAGLAALLADSAVEAVAVCTPPAVRHAVASEALRAGLHVMLEKPPGMSGAEVQALGRLAAERGVTLFTAWHSQWNRAVQEAAGFLAGREVASLDIIWQEDFRAWHPGQEWIWQHDGFGVFDMGINGLSILSRILAVPPFLRGAEFLVAANHRAPIAATLDYATGRGEGPMQARFDWRATGPERREIRLETTDGHRLALLRSGGELEIDGRSVVAGPRAEYPMMYARFAALIAAGASEIDTLPLAMTADAFLMARRVAIPAYP